MDALRRIRRDHEIIHAKLNVIEAALGLPSETWFVLRELCFTLSRQLEDHMHREEELVMRCRSSLNPMVLAEVAIEHHDEPELLRTINRLFTTEPAHSLNHIRPMLKEAITKLRRHMGEEESALFPLLEKILKEGKVKMPAEQPSCVHETMTINRVIHDFPKTRTVLEELFVNVPIEGYHCLDEVAWRHGMKTQKLVSLLEEAIGSCSCKQAPEKVAAEHLQGV